MAERISSIFDLLAADFSGEPLIIKEKEIQFPDLVLQMPVREYTLDIDPDFAQTPDRMGLFLSNETNVPSFPASGKISVSIGMPCTEAILLMNWDNARGEIWFRADRPLPSSI